MVHYQYFVAPKTPLANEVINQIPEIQLYDELNNLYSLDLGDLKKLFEQKFDLQGSGGRTSPQPINFSVHRRLGDDGDMKQLAPAQIEKLMREDLALKPKYLQASGLIKIKNRS